MRPSKLPAYEDQFGPDGNTYFSIRQTKFGVKAFIPTELGELKTHFEFGLMGTGANAGETTFRIRYAYAELGHFGIGQHWSPFMDADVSPATLDSWGPNGTTYFRNVHFRWMPIMGESFLTFALERPGASADEGIYADRIKLDDVNGHFPLPDFSGEYRQATGFGYVELAGMLRYVEWKDRQVIDTTYDLSGHDICWGLTVSSTVHFTDKLKGMFQVVYGNGIQNYMNDAPEDIAIENNFSDPVKPIVGVALPILGISAYFESKWNEKLSSTFGYSLVQITNSNGQDASAFKNGQYITANLIYKILENASAGIEAQYCTRENYLDGWKTDSFRMQFAMKYGFSMPFYQN
jgi:hypothetical protein